MVAKAGNLAGSKKNRIIKIEIQETSFQNMVKTRITEEDKVHIALASRHHNVIYCLDCKRLLKVKESCEPEIIVTEGTEIICDGAFQGNKNVRKVTIPSTVRAIGKYAFKDCENLQYISIPETVTEIPIECFKDCHNLSNVEWHNSITSIWDSAFENCWALRSISFPSQLRSIYDRAFTLSALETFEPTIAEGVKCLIHERAFSFCPNLKKATLSPGVRLAGMMSFIYCENLEEVVFTEEGQGLPGPVETMLIGCNKLKKIIVPAPVTENKYNFNSEKWDTGSFGHCNYNHIVVMSEPK